MQDNTYSIIHYSSVMIGYFNLHTLQNVFEKTDNLSLVKHCNIGFQEDALNLCRVPTTLSESGCLF